jgi:hypothetical protein
MAEPGLAVAGYIARWGPPSVSPVAAAFAPDVVAGAGPERRDRAKSLLYAAARLADWALGTGLEAGAEVLLHPSVIERFAAHSPGLSPPARRTLRTNLRFVARRVAPQLARRTRRFPASGPKPPIVPRRSPGSSRWPPPSPRWGGGCAPPRWSAWAPAPGWPGQTCARSAAPT